MQLFIKLSFNGKTKVFYDPDILKWDVLMLKLQIFGKGLLQDYPSITPNRIYLIHMGKLMDNEKKVNYYGIQSDHVIHINLREIPQIYAKWNCKWLSNNFFNPYDLRRFPSRRISQIKKKIAEYVRENANDLIIRDFKGDIVSDNIRLRDLYDTMGCDLWVTKMNK